MKKIIISVILFFLLVVSVSALWDNILITRRINITTNVTNVSNTYNNYTNNYNQSLNTSDSVMFNNVNVTNNLTVMNRVGIGTTAPLYLLDANGQINARSRFSIIRNLTDSADRRNWGIWTENYQAGDFNIFESASNGLSDPFAGTSRLTIRRGGNVGIGTTNPQQKLHVNGNILTNGTLIVNGSSGINGTYTILKDVDLVGLTKTYCNLTFTGGLMTGSNC